MTTRQHSGDFLIGIQGALGVILCDFPDNGDDSALLFAEDQPAMKNVFLATVFAGVLLTAPVGLNADELQNRTYSDAAHGDKHEWNDNEKATWDRYWREHDIKQSDFAKARRDQQQEYWNWRHEHADDR